MQKLLGVVLGGMIVFVLLCGSAVAAEKDWYLVLRLGYQPYDLDAEGTLAGRDFEASASLSDIMNKTDTTIFGGELEYGKNKWFVNVSGLYQKSEASKGNANFGTDATLKETAFNPMVGYRVYQRALAGGRSLTADLMAGAYYVKVSTEINLYDPDGYGNFSKDGDFNFTDPMIGARGYLGLTEKFGLGASGQIGGFGVGSELHYVMAANLIYKVNDWFAVFGGYKYWYWKYEDNGKALSRFEQTLYGPVVGVELRY